MSKKRRRIPAWAKKERLADMAWIAENSGLFWPAAQQQYREQGKGALVVDTTIEAPGGGHPFFYYSKQQIDEMDNEDAQRMVREYDPLCEMVIVLLKSEERVSVYRVQVVSRPM